MEYQKSLLSYLRVIWAIARKDIVDAIRNKTVLTVLGSVAFTVAMYKLIPYLEGNEELPGLLLHDAGDSALTVLLEESPQLRLYTYDSKEQFERAVTRADRYELGLVLPEDLDERLKNGEAVSLDGYAAYWIDDGEMAALRQIVEEELAFYADGSISIGAELHKLYPQDPGDPGSGFMVSVAIVLVLTMVGTLVVVHLMLEEKQNQTLDALLVSPATPLQLLLGKAVTGAVYALVGVVAVYAVNAAYITHWGLALCAGLCGAALTVGLGLLLGSIFDSRQQLTLWGFLLMNLLLLPMFLVVMSDVLPQPVVRIMHWVPTSAIGWGVRASFPLRAPVGQAWIRLSYVLAWTLVVYGLAAWRVQRLER
jgi:ABC-type Na+ efflux pump permease subunit